MEERIRLSNINVGPIRHPVLPADFIKRVRAFKKVLGDVDRASLEKTIDNFKRDADPESELVIWERIASTFETYLSRNKITDPEIRRDIYLVLLSASMGAEEYKNVEHLSDQQVRQIVFGFRGLLPSS
jgi:hypothetical protein